MLGHESEFDKSNMLDAIMRTVVDEDPHHWPYGCSRHAMDGGCWLMRKRASDEPVGFIGWQNRPVGHKKVGYYAIGVLPEHRRQGYAQQALASLLAEKRATVDEVRAFIVPDNGPSIGLANKLGIPVQHKSAACLYSENTPAFGMDGSMIKMSMQLLRGLGAAGKAVYRNPILRRGILPTVGTDMAVNTDAWFGDAGKTHNLGTRILNAVTNVGLYGGAFRPAGVTAKGVPKAITSGDYLARAGLVGLVPGKDVAWQTLRLLGDNSTRIRDALTQAGKPAMQAGAGIVEQIKQLAQQHPYATGTAAVGGAGLLGLAGLLGYKGVRALENAGQQGGRLKVTLPTRNPGDQETTIEMPFNQINLTPTAVARVTRDLRRRLRAEGKSRTGKRTLADQAVVPFEEEGSQRLTQ